MSAAKVPALDQGLRLLRFLASQRGPVPAQTLASALELPRSTTYQLLGALIDHGYVVHVESERRYGLGIAAWELSGGAARQQPLTRIGRPLLADLVDRVGESGHLAVPHGAEVLYIAEERAPRRPPLVSATGVRLPAHLTATGRAMLATLPRTQVDALFPGRVPFIDRTGIGPRGRRELHAVLTETTQRGYAVEDGEVSAGLRSVAVAVTDHNGWPIAGLGITFDSDPEREEQIVAALTASARTLARRVHGGAATPVQNPGSRT